jgi:3-dehydroquinate synthase
LAEAHIAVKHNLLDEASLNLTKRYILQVFGKLEIAENDLKPIAALCMQDKKNKGNSVLCVLPDGIGRAKWDVEISAGEIEESLSFYRLLQT